MSFYSGIEFFIILFIGLIPAVILGIKEKSLKKYGVLFTIFMIILIYKNNLQECMYLVLFYILQWGIVKSYFIIHQKYNKNKTFYKCYIVLALLPLVISKLTGLVHWNIFSFLGISYVTFKIIQIIIETYDGLIQTMTFFDFSYFILFFPTLSSGPIDRSRRFLDNADCVLAKERYLDLVGDGLEKIVLGAVYKFVISAVFFSLLKEIGMVHRWYAFIPYSYIYGFYMFFDFAGYSLMAIGTSYMLGIKTPDNFNKPFISIDIKDFWNRWHISLSHWFRDFIFSRFIMDSMKKKRFKKRVNAAVAGYMLNMTIMGIWHGLTIDYIVYGMYHGILLALFEKYQKSKFYKKHKKDRWYICCSWFVTLNMVMFGFLIFSGKLEMYLHLLLK